jgi:hypothetical protein
MVVFFFAYFSGENANDSTPCSETINLTDLDGSTLLLPDRR